jgi:hypothetical protein
MRPLTRRTSSWIEAPYRIWLTGAATIGISASGRFTPQFKGAATIDLTGAGILNPNPNPLTGPITLTLTGTGTLTKKPLSRNAPISLTLGVTGTIFRGLIIAAPAVYRTLYRAYLIKTGYADLELPISSFQARRRDGDPSYLAIVVPAPNDYLTGITARTVGGQLVLKSGFVNLATGEETITELQRVDFDYFRYDLGARSGSATLSGHRTTAAREPLTVALQGISYRAVTNGIRTVRCEPDMYLSPGDTADVGDGESFVVSSISYTVNPRAATMEVQEVEA